MRARSVSAAAVLAAAVVVYGLVQRRRCRQSDREAAAQRLMAGCSDRDAAALHAQLEEFRRRLDEAGLRAPVAAAAGTALDNTLATRNSRIDPHTEGGL